MANAGAVIGKRETLNLRIKAEERSLIDRAAKVRGKNRTEFVLEAARSAAEEALLEQSLILLAPSAYARFVDRLDAPPQPNAGLRQTLKAPQPWARG